MSFEIIESRFFKAEIITGLDGIVIAAFFYDCSSGKIKYKDRVFYTHVLKTQ